MKLITTEKAADILSATQQTIQKICKQLGFAKIGRDYLLFPEMVDRIARYMIDHPRGRPCKISREIKDEMIAEAKEEYGEISPCGRKTIDECFTTEGDLIIFWFNNSKGSTKIVTREIE